MKPIRLIFVRPNKGQHASLEFDEDRDRFVLLDEDNVAARIAAVEAVLRIHLPSFSSSRYIVIDGDRGETLCFEPDERAIHRLKQLIARCLDQYSSKGQIKNRILGGVGVVWGGAILVYGFLTGVPQGRGAYAAGGIAGLVFGGLLFVVGW